MQSIRATGNDNSYRIKEFMVLHKHAGAYAEVLHKHAGHTNAQNFGSVFTQKKACS
jgi:hypothetical protein